MTARQHVMAASDHLAQAFDMYGQSHPIDVERGKHMMLALVQSAQKIDL